MSLVVILARKYGALAWCDIDHYFYKNTGFLYFFFFYFPTDIWLAKRDSEGYTVFSMLSSACLHFVGRR